MELTDIRGALDERLFHHRLEHCRRRIQGPGVLHAGLSPRTESRTSKCGPFFGRPLLLRPRSFFWSLKSFFNFFNLFTIWSALRSYPAAVISRCICSKTTFVRVAPSNFFWTSAEDQNPRIQVVSSRVHCDLVFPSFVHFGD